MGCFDSQVRYKSQIAKLPIIVVEGSGPDLLGRNWLKQLVLDWHEIHHVYADSMQTVLNKHPTVFQDGLGKLNNFEAKIWVEPTAQPRFCKARTVPLAMRGKVEEELQRLVGEGILEPVQFSDWAAPIVPVFKVDKSSVRICGDFRQRVNLVSQLDRYPIPKVEDLLATLGKGKAFTKIDRRHAYQ